MSVSLRKRGDYTTWFWTLTDGSRTWDEVMIEEVWENGLYVVRLVNTEETFVAFETELS